MANQYINLLAQAIADLDNNQFPLSHYLYIAWQGVSHVGSQIGLLTNEYASEYYPQYQELTKKPYGKCN